jgi:hypothetical protein
MHMPLSSPSPFTLAGPTAMLPALSVADEDVDIVHDDDDDDDDDEEDEDDEDECALVDEDAARIDAIIENATGDLMPLLPRQARAKLPPATTRIIAATTDNDPEGIDCALNHNATVSLAQMVEDKAADARRQWTTSRRRLLQPQDPSDDSRPTTLASLLRRYDNAIQWSMPYLLVRFYHPVQQYKAQ